MALVEVTDNNFESEILNSDIPVIVDFWAEWCGPCKMLGPIFAELSGERDDVKFVKINVDKAPSTASNYGIMSIPTIAVFKNGEIVDTTVGAVPKGALNKLIDKNK